MQHSMCKLCGERHRLGPCRPDKKAAAAELPVGLLAAAKRDFAKGDTSEARATTVSRLLDATPVNSQFAPRGECPYCDYRRSKVAEAVRLHRARQRSP